jgi:hypothetical protein
MKTNEQIFEEIREQGYITERQLLLIKNRSNCAQKDLFDYDLQGIRVTREQGQKGLDWLRKQARRRKNNPFGKRELDIIANADASDFTFCGFEYTGNWHIVFLPRYELNGMEYIVECGEPKILG